MSHSVRRHLRVEIDAYDRDIRRFVPGYDAMLRVAAGAVAAAGAGGVTLDLGAGTGALSKAILERDGTGVAELLDADPEMLARARARLARFGARARFREGSFDDPIPPCGAVAASLALHHIASMDGKRALYRRICDALPPGGVFVNADATMPAAPEERDAVRRGWVAHMESHGIDEARAYRHLDEWSEEDTYFPLEDELAAMTGAGFDARRIWSAGPVSVLVAHCAVVSAPARGSGNEASRTELRSAGGL